MYLWRDGPGLLARRRNLFELWVVESYSVRQLCWISGYGASTLKAIRRYWLRQSPPDRTDYSGVEYAIYDATYFHKDGCLLNLMDAISGKVIAHCHVRGESFKEALPWFTKLKEHGLNPSYMTVDGEQSIMRAIKLVWPGVVLQRCLYHIQREGMRWLRTNPKTQAGRELRSLLSSLSSVKTAEERDSFVDAYRSWVNKYRESIRSLPREIIASKDLRRTMVLINNALPDMFRYIDNPQIRPTTNSLEGFHSRLKAAYWRHRGLTKSHRPKYIDWYCYLTNG